MKTETKPTECLCKITVDGDDIFLEKCSVCKAAPELLKLLKMCAEIAKADYKIHSGLKVELEAAIAEAEGGK